MPITTARSAGRHSPLWSLHRSVFDLRFFNRSHTLLSQSAEGSDQSLETGEGHSFGLKWTKKRRPWERNVADSESCPPNVHSLLLILPGPREQFLVDLAKFNGFS